MRCPYCDYLIVEAWEPLYSHGEDGNVETSVRKPIDNGWDIRFVEVEWAACLSKDCGEIIVRIRRGHCDFETGVKQNDQSLEQWIAIPRKPHRRAINPLVPEPFKTDYIEASDILDASPRMSAVLSRRILADLLQRYAGRSEFHLASRIDKFIDDKAHPSNIKENLHHLREMGDFGAHTQTNGAGEIIDVGPEEAEWTLDVIDGLLDYFILGPEKDRLRREAIEKKIQAAGRRPPKKPA